MRIRILLQHIEKHPVTRQDGFSFVIVDFFGARIFDCTLGINFSCNPSVQALLDKLILPSTPEYLLPEIFSQFLSALKKNVPDLTKHYFTAEQLDSAGRYSYTIDQAHQKRNLQQIEGELEFVPVVPVTVKLSPVVLDFEKLRDKSPAYRVYRFCFIEVPVLLNRTNYERVKVFQCKGNENEKAYIHCYFNGNRIKRFKLLRGEGFDKEQARYCFEFLKQKLQERYQFI